MPRGTEQRTNEIPSNPCGRTTTCRSLLALLGCHWRFAKKPPDPQTTVSRGCEVGSRAKAILPIPTLKVNGTNGQAGCWGCYKCALLGRSWTVDSGRYLAHPLDSLTASLCFGLCTRYVTTDSSRLCLNLAYSSSSGSFLPLPIRFYTTGKFLPLFGPSELGYGMHKILPRIVPR